MGVGGCEGVGVCVGVAAAGVMLPPGEGVPVPPGLGVGEGGRTGITSTCPSESELGSAILLYRTMSSTLTPNISAIPDKVSPAFTRYVTGGTVGTACGVGVAVAIGVITSLIGTSAPPPALPQAASASVPTTISKLARSRYTRGRAVCGEERDKVNARAFERLFPYQA